MSSLNTPEYKEEADDKNDNFLEGLSDLEDFDLDQYKLDGENFKDLFELLSPSTLPTPQLDPPPPQTQNQEGMEMDQDDNTSNHNIDEADQRKDVVEENGAYFPKSDAYRGQSTSASSLGEREIVEASSLDPDDDDLNFFKDDAEEEEKEKDSKNNGKAGLNIIPVGEMLSRYPTLNFVQAYAFEVEVETEADSVEEKMYDIDQSTDDDNKLAQTLFDFDGELAASISQNKINILAEKDNDDADCHGLKLFHEGTSQDSTYDPTADFLIVNSSAEVGENTSDYHRYLPVTKDPMFSSNSNITATRDVIKMAHAIISPAIIIPPSRSEMKMHHQAEPVKKQFPKIDNVKIPMSVKNKRKSSHCVKQDYEGQLTQDNKIPLARDGQVYVNLAIEQEQVASTSNNAAVPGKKSKEVQREERKKYAKNYRIDRKKDMEELKSENAKLSKDVISKNECIAQLYNELEEFKSRCTCQPSVAVGPSRKKRKKST